MSHKTHIYFSYLLKTYNAPNCANSRAGASHRCDFAPPPFGENMLQRGIKEIKLFPFFFFLLTPGSSLKQRRVMRVHLLSSMHCTKLSWHDRKFACNPRPWRQISVGMAEQRQCMKACIRLMLFYSANHDWSSLPALSLFHFLSESWQITVTTSPFNPTVHNRCESIVHFLVQVQVMNKKKKDKCFLDADVVPVGWCLDFSKTRLVAAIYGHNWSTLSTLTPLKSRAALNLIKKNK